ncbi:MAG TPA: hypothetical protein VLD57_00920 [Blastocatellia bacterium]|nr:hypothetical protein [Blastocatellia bacterium]
MKYKGLMFLTVVFVMLTSLTAGAQTGEEYNDPDGKFKLTLFSEWRPISYNDAVGRQKTEFIYRDRSEGLLKISRESLPGGSLSELVRSEEENLKIYRSGFDRAASEPFGGGSLSGMRLSFYSTDGGRQTANTYYYLKDGNSVWVLRFSGKRGSLDINRNVSDQIARSFQSL